MMPVQRLKKAIIEKVVRWGGFEDREIIPDITKENIDKLYDDLDEKDYLHDAKSEIQYGGIETGLESPSYSRHYESREVAMEIDGIWIGWTYWYGGGKHADPGSIDWIDDAYELDMMYVPRNVKVFSRIKPKDS